MKIGIMGAMDEEIALLKKNIREQKKESSGQREYVRGHLQGHEVTVVFSRWGKVAAAATTVALIEKYQVDLLIFTGVAGALDNRLNIGDIVVADALLQHDMDVSELPGIKKFEIPLLGISHFPVEEELVHKTVNGARGYLEQDLTKDVDKAELASFGIEQPKVVVGTIGSGDRFIAGGEVAATLKKELPELKCVEMEGGAVAQVAYEYNIPAIVLRTISDKADEKAGLDFPRFVAKVASPFTCGSVMRLLTELDGQARNP